MIKTIKIEINLGNEYIQTKEDVANLLKRAADKIEDLDDLDDLVTFKKIILRDVAGNAIGFIKGE